MSHILSVQDLRAFDQAIDASGRYTLAQLMREAGVAVARLALQKAPTPCRVYVLTGPGNNGGDALVAAAVLYQRGYAVTLVIPQGVASFRPLPQQVFQALPAALKTQPILSVLPELPMRSELEPVPLIIDGLFGTGFNPQKAMPENIRQCIASANRARQHHRCRILSIDIPSGINGDNCHPSDIATEATAGSRGAGAQPPSIRLSHPSNIAIEADWTLTLVAATPALTILGGANSPRYCGQVTVVHLSGEELLKLPPAPTEELFDYSDAAETLPRIAWNAHKYKRGNVCVIGCSKAYGGAALLSAISALKCGAGIVTAIIPEDANTCLRSIPNALIVKKLPFIGEGAIAQLLAELTRANVIVIGPGMTADLRLAPLVTAVKHKTVELGIPLVMDADALNIAAQCPEILTPEQSGFVVLTPHPGEYSRLCKALKLDENDDEFALAREFTQRTGAYLVSKGARMYVTPPTPPQCIHFINAGCPALGTAGSGDVLTGAIAAMLAMTPSDARSGTTIALGCWLHAKAAERLSTPADQFGLIADELPDAIRAILRELA